MHACNFRLVRFVSKDNQTLLTTSRAVCTMSQESVSDYESKEEIFILTYINARRRVKLVFFMEYNIAIVSTVNRKNIHSRHTIQIK